MKTIATINTALLLLAFVWGKESIAQSNLNFTYAIAKRASINPVNNFDTLYAWQCLLTVEDTTVISKIHYQMGSAYGLSDKVDHAFDFDEDAYLPNGLDYRRKGYEIWLGVGNFKNRPYYIEVQLEDTLQNLSPWVKWNNQ